MIRRFALLAVLGLIPAVVYSAAPASAATSPADDQFGVFSAGSPTAHVGDLTVVLGSSATITGVTAHLIVAGTGNDVLDQVLSETASAPIGSSQTQSTWSVPTAITEAELPLDTYRTRLRVNAITLVEDAAKPESWLRDTVLVAWNAAGEEWMPAQP